MSVTFNPTGNRILTATSDGKVKLWDLSGKCLAIFPHDHCVRLAKFSHTGNHIITISDDFKIRVWEMKEFTQFKNGIVQLLLATQNTRVGVNSSAQMLSLDVVQNIFGKFKNL